MHLSKDIVRPMGRHLAAVAASGVMAGLYAQGGMAWTLGFVMLVPWLLSLGNGKTLAASVGRAWLMSVAFTASTFWWFGMAIGDYTGVGAPAGLAILLLLAPLFQPQFMAFAMVRYCVGTQHSRPVVVLASVAAWGGMEWIVPKVLGDTLGYGLYPSVLMRQFADLGGSAGLTALLLLTNEGFALAWSRRTHGWLMVVRTLAFTALIPAGIAAYGVFAFAMLPKQSNETLRIGLVQSNLVDYERRRQTEGANAVVREILDTHFAMTYDAVERQKADAVLWTETVYPTTFGHPKSEAGAEFDAAIQTIVNAAKVPFVFGTYDRDAKGEYNAAAFVLPESGLLGFYRKTRLFPLTEYVPVWLDSPTLRKWLPWTGSWVAGNGARVFPLRLKDGREIPVMASICLDDVDTGLAIAGARLGAQAMLTLSNDSWFTRYPQGAQLHHAVAAFRSIETRMPQYRVTSNGYSAIIDTTGTVVAGSHMGERTLVVGGLPVPVPPRTLMVAWGNWVGLAGCAFLMWLALLTVSSWLRDHRGAALAATTTAMQLPATAFVLPTTARYVAALLRAFSRANLLWMGAAMLLNESLRGSPLAQLRAFAGFFLVPEIAAWCVLLAYSARISIENGMLILQRNQQRMELALKDIVAIELWKFPVPGPGASLRLASGSRWDYGLSLAQPLALAQALTDNGAAALQQADTSRAMRYARARSAPQRGRLDSPWVKFLVFPTILAIPAFHLHQNIAYGGGLGELYTFGAKAYLVTFSLWWAAWAMGVLLSAAALRAMIEAGSLLTMALLPNKIEVVRQNLERMGLSMLYLGLPGWLALNAGW
jgi:apolipoprotein N-acyltransferase